MPQPVASVGNARAAEIYRQNSCRKYTDTSDTGNSFALRSPRESDTIAFSEEALEKAKLLETIGRGAAPAEGSIQRRDAALKRSLSVLDLDTGATVEEIKAAYHYLMKQYHPDKYAHMPPEFRKLAEARSRQIIQAYKALVEKCFTVLLFSVTVGLF